MIRRVFRLIVAALCLLSLLVALGTSWLWWEYEHGRGIVGEATLGGMRLWLGSVSGMWEGDRITLMLVRGWPGPTGVRVWTQRDEQVHTMNWSGSRMLPWRRFHLSGQAGTVTVLVMKDTGEPVRWWGVGSTPDQTLVRSSGPMPAWSVSDIPHAAVIATALVPPLLWIGIRWCAPASAAAACGWGCA